MTDSPDIDIDEQIWEGETMLLNAVKSNEIHMVKYLLEKRVNIHHVDRKGNTALHIAYGGKSEIISLLLAAGAKVDVENSENQTPLHVAANASDTEMINLLIEAKANINCLDKRGQTPLAICVENSDFHTATCLLRNGAEVNTVNNNGVTPLICAVQEEDEQLVELLIVHKADVNFTDHKQTTALMYALLVVNKHIVSKLIQAGADVNIRITQCYRDANRIKYDLLEEAKNASLDSSEHNLTPLHIAAQTFPEYQAQKSVEVVNVLLKGGANVHAVNEDDRTPLHIAAIYGDLDIVKSLIKAGSNINAKDKFGNTPLLMSLLYKHQEVLKYFIESGTDIKAEVNHQNVNGKTPLMIACVNGNVEAAEALLKAGANVFLVDKNKNTALHHCAQNGIELLPLVEKLVLHSNQNNDEFRQENTFVSNANLIVYAQENDLFNTSPNTERKSNSEIFINMTNENKESALHIACKLGHLNIVKFLIRKKCKLDCTTSSGQTPLTIASKYQFTAVVKCLIKNNVNVNMRDNNGETALHAAVKGAENYLQDRTRKTALHFKSKSSNYSIISALLELGSNPDITTNEGITALMIAVNKGHLPFVKILVDNGACVNIRDCEGRNACMHALMPVTNTADSCLRADGYFYYNQSHIIRNYLPVFRETDDLFEIINVLVTAGADLNILDNENRSLIVYTLLNVERNSQEECIQRFLRLGFNLILHENHRYLLNKCMLTYDRAHYEKISLHDVLENNSKCIFQILLINGITLCHSVSNYTLCHDSNFRCALRYRNYYLLRFLLATGHVYSSDLKSLRYDSYFEDNANHYLNFNDSLHAELALAKREPWPLVKLAFIEVSTLLGTGPMREEKLKQTKLPPRLQRTLMFQEPISRLPVEDWSNIPLCFDPVQYETLPCPRPLLYYWPVGYRLVN